MGGWLARLAQIWHAGSSSTGFHVLLFVQCWAPFPRVEGFVVALPLHKVNMAVGEGAGGKGCLGCVDVGAHGGDKGVSSGLGTRVEGGCNKASGPHIFAHCLLHLGPIEVLLQAFQGLGTA
ncbi:hypothetical protein HaLaN_19095 [Haematococcus lacustris]|uniref:Uncharacterized protein n=1 Tax=Haematococcus lacustris TaxID=44745 RepID=A0A699ZSJ5_HAELA|nr:hypothetical protein HaLaN_19095 [Haematococcus lacustris]